VTKCMWKYLNRRRILRRTGERDRGVRRAPF
jgi:hypothetical protein